ALRSSAVGATLLANFASLSLLVPVMLAVAPALLRAVAPELVAAGTVLLAGAALGCHRGEQADAPPPTADTRMFRSGQALGLAAGRVRLAVAALGFDRGEQPDAPPPTADTRMFRIGQALGLAALIAGVLFLAQVAAQWLGPKAALGAALLTALAELQAAAATVATLFGNGTIDAGQARWAVIGLFAASALAKSVVAFASGGAAFGIRIAVGLGAMTAAALAVALRGAAFGA